MALLVAGAWLGYFMERRKQINSARHALSQP